MLHVAVFSFGFGVFLEARLLFNTDSSPAETVWRVPLRPRLCVLCSRVAAHQGGWRWKMQGRIDHAASNAVEASLTLQESILQHRCINI